MFTRVPRYFARDSADLAALSELTVSTAERNAHDVSQGSLSSDGMIYGLRSVCGDSVVSWLGGMG